MANSSSRDKFVIPNPDSLSLEPPMTLIVIGMAGSGKTTFTQASFKSKPSFIATQTYSSAPCIETLFLLER